MSWSKTFEMLAPALGGAAGAALAPFTGGLSIGAGAMLGSSLGGAVGGGLSLLDNPTIPGASPEAVMNMQRSNYTAGRLASGNGLSDSVYNRYMMGTQRSLQADIGSQLGVVRELGGRLSPLLLEGLSRGMVDQQTKMKQAQADITQRDLDAEINNLKMSLMAGRQASADTQFVNSMENKKKLQELAVQDNKMKAFSSVISNLTNVVSALPKKTKQPIVKTKDPFKVEDSDTANMQQYSTPTSSVPSAQPLAEEIENDPEVIKAKKDYMVTAMEAREAENDVEVADELANTADKNLALARASVMEQRNITTKVNKVFQVNTKVLQNCD